MQELTNQVHGPTIQSDFEVSSVLQSISRCLAINFGHNDGESANLQLEVGKKAATSPSVPPVSTATGSAPTTSTVTVTASSSSVATVSEKKLCKSPNVTKSSS